MNYQLIHNVDSLRKFIELLPDLKENESYFLILIARKKWCPESNIPSALKLKREAVTKQNIIRTIRQWETEIGTYTTYQGVNIPQDNIGVYIAYNPKDQRKATFNMVKKCLEAIEREDTGINIRSMANDVIQSSNGTKNFMDIDVDIKEGEDYLEIVKFIKSVLNEEYLTFVKTSGGFHCLIHLNKAHIIHTHLADADNPNQKVENLLSPNYGKKWYQTLQKHPFKSELNIMSNDLMPLVGCNQGKFVLYQF